LQNPTVKEFEKSSTFAKVTPKSRVAYFYWHIFYSQCITDN